MGVREHNVHSGGYASGYRLVNYEMNFPVTAQNTIQSIVGVPTPAIFDHAAFAGGPQAMICPRTVTVTIIPDATVSTRILRVILRGYNSLNRSVTSDMTLTTTASVTIRVETPDIFAFLESIEIVSSSGFVAGDATHFGNFGDSSGNLTHFRTIFWGLPVQCKGIRRDITAGNEGFLCNRGEIIARMIFYTPSATLFFGPLGAENIANLRYDEEKGGFRWNAAPVLDPDTITAANMVKISMLIRTLA